MSLHGIGHNTHRHPPNTFAPLEFANSTVQDPDYPMTSTYYQVSTRPLAHAESSLIRYC